jgi:hypothetical protein
MVAQDAALPQDGERDGHAEQAEDQQRRAPVHHQQQRRDDGRAGGEAEIAGEGVHGEGAADARLVDGGAEDGVVGRVDDRVAEAGEDRERQDHPVVRREGHRGHRQAHQQHAAHQVRPRPVPVHQEADRRLQRRRHRAHQREGEAEFRVGDAEFRPPGQEQRRQAEHVEVAQEVAGADQREDARVASGAVRGGLRWHEAVSRALA